MMKLNFDELSFRLSLIADLFHRPFNDTYQLWRLDFALNDQINIDYWQC